MVAVLDDQDAPTKDREVGWLTFIDPKQQVRTSLPVTLGPSFERRFGGRSIPVWHIEIGDGWAETSPSIHVPGEYHSPGVVRWRLVPNDRLETEAGARDQGEL
jgi:hypothetical protein